MASKQEVWHTISNNIKRFRLANNWTQEEVSEMLHISFSHYRKIEAPNVIVPCSLDLLINISDLFEIEISELFSKR
jgi:transcriptional regulator with XRE-family HTH domain